MHSSSSVVDSENPLDTTYGFPVRPLQDGISRVSGGFDPVTGEVLDGYDARLRRWELQSAARHLLRGERVETCLRVRRKDVKGVTVYRRVADSSAYYAGLTVCGLPWVCPVCAAKISERRRGELVQAVSEWQSLGGSLAFLTLTVPHSARSEAFGLVDTLLDLVERFNSGRNRMSAILPGYIAQVRALEVTHGDHGWHPHLHILLFLQNVPDLPALEDRLWSSWSALVSSSRLGRPSRAAFSLQDGSQAAQYASKWGIPEEMTKGHFKTARTSRGRTPFALLADHLKGDRQAGALFVEFAQAFKGKRQLRWSPNLRRLLGIGQEKTDLEEAATVDATDELLGAISDAQWSIILRHNLRGHVLEVLRSGQWSDFQALIHAHQGGSK